MAKGRLQDLQAAPTQVEEALKPLLVDVRTTGLDASEEVALGLSYLFVFDAARAKPLLEKHYGRDDLLGRVSSARTPGDDVQPGQGLRLG